MCQTDFYGFLKPYPAAGVWSLRPLLYRTSPGYSFLWGHSVPLRSSTFQHHTAYRPRSYSGWSVDCRCQRNTYTECHTGSQGDSSGPRGRGRSSGHWCSVHSSTHQCTDHKIPSLKIYHVLKTQNILQDFKFACQNISAKVQYNAH